MYCLRCHTQMKKGSLKGILVDTCPNCKSFWLDKEELDYIREGKRKTEQELKKEAKYEKRMEAAVGVHGACPKCWGKLASHAEGTVQLDRCTRCEGIFFDRGELEACIKMEKTTFMQKIFSMIRGE